MEFLGIWESVNNPDFNSGEFDRIRSQAGLNSYRTQRQAVDAKDRRHRPASPVPDATAAPTPTRTSPSSSARGSARNSSSTSSRNSSVSRTTKTTASSSTGTSSAPSPRSTTASTPTPSSETLIPPAVTKAQAPLVYANEADLLNVALFGQTAKQWRDANPDAEGNIRDHAPLEQLVVLTNLESLNSVLIRQGLPQPERLLKLNEIAITQMRSPSLADNTMKRLK